MLAAKRCFLGFPFGVTVIGRANRGRANDFSAATLVTATPAGTLSFRGSLAKKQRILLYILR